MTKVPKQHNLTKRNGVWYYRRRVPQGLEEAMGKSIIQFSLKTKDFKVAARMRDELDVTWNDRFDEVARRSPDPVQATAALTRHEALKMVREYVKEADQKFLQMEAKRGVLSKEVLQDIEMDLSLTEQAVADISSREGEEHVGRKVKDLLKDQPTKLEVGDPFRDDFFEIVRRGMLEVYRRAIARHQQDFSHPYFDELFAPSNRSSGVVSNAIPMAQVCDEYIEDYERRAEQRNVRKKRRHDLRVGADLVLEVIGRDMPVQDVTRKMCRDFVDALSKLPPNRRKRFKDLPLDKVLAKADKQGLPPMKWETQNSYLSTLIKIMDFARKEGYVDRNPAEGLSPLAETVPDEDKRDPYSMEHLRAIFTAPLFTGCKNDERGYNTPGPNHPKRSRFWLPLIGLLTGMRMNEICQLNLDDVKCTEAGTHYFHVFPTTKGQRVKNLSSRRKVPLHPMLIRMGFLDFVDELRSNGEESVFPEIPTPKSGYKSDNFTKRYATFQKGVGIPQTVGVFPNEKKYSFHSFRHNFRDELRKTEAPIEIVELLGGWASGHKAVNKTYGAGYEPDQLYEYIKEVAYPGLDLSHLYVKDE